MSIIENLITGSLINITLNINIISIETLNQVLRKLVGVKLESIPTNLYIQLTEQRLVTLYK